MAADNPQEAIVVQCGSCYVTVFGDVVGAIECTKGEEFETWYRAVLIRCPSCGDAVFATQAMEPVDKPGGGFELDWSDAKRMWPNREDYLDWAIPVRVRTSLEQARKCVNAGTYLAAAVMVRRALEAIVNQFDVPRDRSLPVRIAVLRDTGVIDARMFEWADVLRKHGNLGAHDSEGEVSKEDARDLLEFAETICDYIFVMSKKFDEFHRRQMAAAPVTADGEDPD